MQRSSGGDLVTHHLCSSHLASQARFGPAGGDTFKMFSSTGDVDLLFKDSTECLVEVPPDQSIWEFLGAKYVDIMTSLRKCEESRSGESTSDTQSLKLCYPGPSRKTAMNAYKNRSFSLLSYQCSLIFKLVQRQIQIM